MEVFCEKGFLRNCVISQENTYVGVSFHFIEKILQHSCFPENAAEYLRISILNKIWERVLLKDLSMTCIAYLRNRSIKVYSYLRMQYLIVPIDILIGKLKCERRYKFPNLLVQSQQ